MKKVVFLCVHNSGRSQMAEAFAKRLGAGTLIAESAGTQPGSGLNPQVVQAMQEIGYDMAGHYPKVMTEEMVETADKVITMGCGVNPADADTGGAAVCPAVFVESEDWPLEDPKGKPLEKVREIRDQIKQKVERLVQELSDE